MQDLLDFYMEDYILEDGLEKHRESRQKNVGKSLGEMVRDYSYRQIVNKEDTVCQRAIIDTIINSHPEGITDLEICILTGISRSSVNARRNELDDVIPVGFAKYTDERGNDHLNTLWGKIL
jgi:hypothetical protein